MQIYPMRPRGRNPSRLADWPPDLFAWADNRIIDPQPPLPRTVAYVSRRYRLSPTFAALAALHSGLGGRNHD
jgi:hypothetical protein